MANNAVGFLALFVALGGVGYAATGGFTSNGKLQACVNEEGRLKLLQAGQHCKKGQKAVAWNQSGPAGAIGATGATGAAGAAGATGAAGASLQGPQGATGASAASSVVVRTKTVKLGGGGQITESVECEPGERAIGGGVVHADGDTSGLDAVLSSAPFNDEHKPAQEGDTPVAWVIGFHIGGAATVNFYAICVQE